MEKSDLNNTNFLENQDYYLNLISELMNIRKRGEVPLAYIHTYGCQQNVADSEKIKGMLSKAGFEFVEGPDDADFILFNTCAVREHAEDRVFGNVGALKKIKKKHPQIMIAVCGCMMEQKHIAERMYNSFPFVSLVFGTHSLQNFPELYYRALFSGKRVYERDNDDKKIYEGIPIKRDGTFKGWLPIMYGCDNFCTYCIVPYVRGRERSRKSVDVISEAKELINSGYKDITLLGQNVNSYGKDLDCGMDFADLLAAVAELDGEFRLRFMTSHPKDASRKLFDTIAKYDKICKQFHLPFQSGNDRVLHAMNRRYTAAQYLELVDYGRSLMPELVLTSDVIVGFPGETEAEFEDTLKLIERVRYDALFTFIFSPRAGTPAASMDDPTPRAEKNQRFDRLCALQNRISEEKHREYVGKTLRVLVDGRDGDKLTARTDGGRLVRLDGGDELIGQFLNVTVTDSTTWSLVGER